MEASSVTKARKASWVGEANSNWRGGISRRQDGYNYEKARWHPFATRSGYVLQHRLVMERWFLQNDPASKFLIYVDGHLVLSPDYEVHHKDEDRAHNDISNLLCLTSSEHKEIHRKMNAKKE